MPFSGGLAEDFARSPPRAPAAEDDMTVDWARTDFALLDCLGFGASSSLTVASPSTPDSSTLGLRSAPLEKRAPRLLAAEDVMAVEGARQLLASPGLAFLGAATPSASSVDAAGSDTVRPSVPCGVWEIASARGILAGIGSRAADATRSRNSSPGSRDSILFGCVPSPSSSSRSMTIGLAWVILLQVAAASMSGSVPSNRCPPLRSPSQTATPLSSTASSACHCHAKCPSAKLRTRLFRCALSVCWPSSFSRTRRSNSDSPFKGRCKSTKGVCLVAGATAGGGNCPRASCGSVGDGLRAWLGRMDASSCVACWSARAREGSVGGSAT
mmetsp:Transcript_53201/g.124026  ORF Transcript_53201/g.124026 Transcript_53201/m.124026 type:complete len:327 (+) Transcript_53201:74-1054(+)